ncbi:MAG: hypothetical protein QXQ60_08805 [Thermofilum sp.]
MRGECTSGSDVDVLVISGSLPRSGLERAKIKVKIKMKDIGAKTLKAAVKAVARTSQSMGVRIDGKPPKVFIKDLESGVYDELLEKYARG